MWFFVTIKKSLCYIVYRFDRLNNELKNKKLFYDFSITVLDGAKSLFLLSVNTPDEPIIVPVVSFIRSRMSTRGVATPFHSRTGLRNCDAPRAVEAPFVFCDDARVSPGVSRSPSAPLAFPSDIWSASRASAGATREKSILGWSTPPLSLVGSFSPACNAKGGYSRRRSAGSPRDSSSTSLDPWSYQSRRNIGVCESLMSREPSDAWGKFENPGYWLFLWRWLHVSSSVRELRRERKPVFLEHARFLIFFFFLPINAGLSTTWNFSQLQGVEGSR